MKTEVFPINYIKSIWTPIKTFTNRFKLSWPNMVVVLIFLNALMTIPVTINFAQMETFPIEELYPNAANILENEELEELNKTTDENGEMQISTPFISENEYGIVASGVSPEGDNRLANEKTLYYLQQTNLVLRKREHQQQ